jgi:vacuolar-type H+-ATPase subunit F/Vma7
VSVNDLMSSAQFRMELKNPEAAAKNKKYKNSGSLIVQAVEVEYVPSFLDYIKGGCTINLMVAIDYTGSNGDPNSIGTLHYRGGNGNNQYQQAIRAIGTILAPYDTDNMIPVWGFGGRVFGEVSHCFAITFDESKPEVRGVDGILKAYNDSFKNITLSGPTLFQQIIETASTISDVAQTQEKQNYNILLILTDGTINDMPATIQAIKRANKLPLSIIIVGVGEADFADMEKLDGDDEAKESKVRDIVQFVPFSKFAGNHISMLAKETLAEVPSQFLGYMKSKGITPNPARPAPPKPEQFNSPMAEPAPAFDFGDSPPTYGNV